MFGQTNFVAGLMDPSDALLELFDIRGGYCLGKQCADHRDYAVSEPDSESGALAAAFRARFYHLYE